ncbi:cardiolipin synthase [Clostridium neuense]|uniref:Cardiolipin synthase n=1 Tax=Clostridium neuense TaxID=1728934 RepID=A0ABW8TKR9_9CLOT
MKISPFAITIGIIYFINFISIVITIFVERKKPLTATVWIFILSLIPILGFLLYFVFGRNLRPNQKRIFRLKKEYDTVYNSWLIEEKYLLNNDDELFNDANIAEYKDIIEMNINSNRSIYSQDNEVSIFTNGKDKYEALLKDIENAKETINILYFIIKNDTIGRKMVDLLTKKAKQGVEVRVLYDHIGSFHTPSRMFDKLKKAGGKVTRFFPLSFGTYCSINYRNHRKIVVIDGSIGYVGGINIGDEYMGEAKGKYKKLRPWRDTHIRIVGTSVMFLQERFLMDWYYATKDETVNEDNRLKKFFHNRGGKGKIGVQIVASGPDLTGEQIKMGYIKMINSAKDRVYLQTPYFIPDDSFLEALKISAMSGVDVRMMLPLTPDKNFVYHATTSYIQDLLDYGIKVYLYKGFLHSKMVAVDGRIVSLGTANLDIRSFSLDFEINAFIYDTEFAEKCISIFEDDMKKSEIVTMEKYKARGTWNKTKEGFSRLFSPLL